MQCLPETVGLQRWVTRTLTPGHLWFGAFSCFVMPSRHNRMMIQWVQAVPACCRLHPACMSLISYLHKVAECTRSGFHINPPCTWLQLCTQTLPINLATVVTMFRYGHIHCCAAIASYLALSSASCALKLSTSSACHAKHPVISTACMNLNSR